MDNKQHNNYISDQRYNHANLISNVFHPQDFHCIPHYIMHMGVLYRPVGLIIRFMISSEFN